MSVEDDNFIREVNEELRSDQATALWKKYGKFIIGGAVAIVLGVAGNVFYQDWQTKQAGASGDIFLKGITAARDGEQEEALAAFAELETGGYGSYPVLAKMRSATVLYDQGKLDEAIAAFKAIVADSAAPDALQDIARIRAAYLLVDHGSYEAVSAEVELLTNLDNPMRHSAREALGLSAFKSNDLTRAKEWMELIVQDIETPRPMVARAQIILDLIAGRSAAG